MYARILYVIILYPITAAILNGTMGHCTAKKSICLIVQRYEYNNKLVNDSFIVYWNWTTENFAIELVEHTKGG